MQEDIDTTIEEYFQNLPPEVRKRLEGNWGNDLLQQLKRNNIPEQYHEDIKDDVFLNLAEIKTPEETCRAIKQLLPLDSRALDALCEDLKYKILVDISPEEGAPQNPTESQAGVDILPDENLDEESTQPSSVGRESLLQGIEHPEDSARIEDAARKGEVYNPVSSKLGGSTLGTRPQAPQYKGSDPYRESIK